MATLAQVIRNIKSLKIQGASAVAIAGLKAWAKAKNKSKAAKLLISARPTEPMLFNALEAVKKGYDPYELIAVLEADLIKIGKIGAKLIKNKMSIFTHCHSSTVASILIEAKKQGKKFEVHNTETRPMYQGRIMAKELAKAGIKVYHYVDSAAMQAIEKADIFFIGADWISSKGIVNKIGTGMFAEIANKLKVPIYCCAHSWKFSKKEIKIEQRPAGEVWKNAPKGVNIYNPAFELAERKYIKGIVSELGKLNYVEFLKKVKK